MVEFEEVTDFEVYTAEASALASGVQLDPEVEKQLSLAFRRYKYIMKLRIATGNTMMGLCRMTVGFHDETNSIKMSELNAKAKNIHDAVINKKVPELGPEDQVAAKAVQELLLEIYPNFRNFELENKKYVKILEDSSEKFSEHVLEWVDDHVKGVGRLTVAKVIGMTGDLLKYDDPAKVWKRLGVAVLPDKNGRLVRQGGDGEGMDKKTWIVHGYRPHFRSEVALIGDNLRRQKHEYFYPLYLRRKEYELEKLKPEEEERKKAARKKGWKGYAIKAHADKRALRFIEKRFLLHLWSVWTGKDWERRAA